MIFKKLVMAATHIYTQSYTRRYTQAIKIKNEKKKKESLHQYIHIRIEK